MAPEPSAPAPAERRPQGRSESKGSSSVELQVTASSLALDACAALVADDAAGAVATFTGVTRNSFQGKAVLWLEYEAYLPMAAKKLLELCQEACRRWALCKVAIAHRTGRVGVGEASVLIAASSAHRREALEACHWAIDELKATVPIWKKEFYEGGEVWKENEEWRQEQQQQRRLRRAAEAAAEGGGDELLRFQQQQQAGLKPTGSLQKISSR